MTSERITFRNFTSEIVRLVKTRDLDGFLAGLEYAAKMNELNARLNSPEMKIEIAKAQKRLSRHRPIVLRNRYRH